MAKNFAEASRSKTRPQFTVRGLFLLLMVAPPTMAAGWQYIGAYRETFAQVQPADPGTMIYVRLPAIFRPIHLVDRELRPDFWGRD